MLKRGQADTERLFLMERWLGETPKEEPFYAPARFGLLGTITVPAKRSVKPDAVKRASSSVGYVTCDDRDKETPSES